MLVAVAGRSLQSFADRCSTPTDCCPPTPAPGASPGRSTSRRTGLPIVSPHGHVPASAVRRRRAIADPAARARHARTTTCCGCSTARACRWSASGCRPATARHGGDRRSSDLAHLRRALPPVPGHPLEALARPHPRRGPRRHRAARGRTPPTRSTTTSSRRSPTDAFRPRALYERFGIELLATTDAALDPLEAHAKIARQRVGRAGSCPTFRPDDVVDPDRPGLPGQPRPPRRA